MIPLILDELFEYRNSRQIYFILFSAYIPYFFIFIFIILGNSSTAPRRGCTCLMLFVYKFY